MSKVLYLKANAKEDSESRTFKISEIFIEEYKKNHPEDEIITLDLYKENIEFLPFGHLNELHGADTEKDREHPILKYAYQFVESDKYVIAAPFWNLSIPAILKAYIDYIAVPGVTFAYTANGPVGLCHNKKGIHIVTRGGSYVQPPYSDYEMGARYLRTILGFLGITDFNTVVAENLDVFETDKDAEIKKAIDQALELAKNF